MNLLIQIQIFILFQNIYLIKYFVILRDQNLNQIIIFDLKQKITNFLKLMLISLRLNFEYKYNIYLLFLLLICIISSIIIRSQFINVDEAKLLYNNNDILYILISLLIFLSIIYCFNLIFNIIKKCIQLLKIIPEFKKMYNKNIKNIKTIISLYYIQNVLLIILSCWILYNIIIKLNLFIDNIYIYILIIGFICSIIFLLYYPLKNFNFEYINNTQNYSIYVYVLLAIFIFLYIVILPLICINLINSDKFKLWREFKNTYIKKCIDSSINNMSPSSSASSVPSSSTSSSSMTTNPLTTTKTTVNTNSYFSNDDNKMASWWHTNQHSFFEPIEDNFFIDQDPFQNNDQIRRRIRNSIKQSLTVTGTSNNTTITTPSDTITNTSNDTIPIINNNDTNTNIVTNNTTDITNSSINTQTNTQNINNEVLVNTDSINNREIVLYNPNNIYPQVVHSDNNIEYEYNEENDNNNAEEIITVLINLISNDEENKFLTCNEYNFNLNNKTHNKIDISQFILPNYELKIWNSILYNNIKLNAKSLSFWENYLSLEHFYKKGEINLRLLRICIYNLLQESYKQDSHNLYLLKMFKYLNPNEINNINDLILIKNQLYNHFIFLNGKYSVLSSFKNNIYILNFSSFDYSYLLSKLIDFKYKTLSPSINLTSIEVKALILQLVYDQLNNENVNILKERDFSLDLYKPKNPYIGLNLSRQEVMNDILNNNIRLDKNKLYYFLKINNFNIENINNIHEIQPNKSLFYWKTLKCFTLRISNFLFNIDCSNKMKLNRYIIENKELLYQKLVDFHLSLYPNYNKSLHKDNMYTFIKDLLLENEKHPYILDKELLDKLHIESEKLRLLEKLIKNNNIPNLNNHLLQNKNDVVFCGEEKNDKSI